jgi:DNA-binding transcriptional MerR regulator
MPKPKTVRPDELVTSGEFSHAVRVDKATISRWVAKGLIEPVEIAGVRFYYRADMERIAAERAGA